MSEVVPPTKQALEDSLLSSVEILNDIELNQLPLSNIALKTSRLARLLNDIDFQRIMELEVGGYPIGADGIQPDIWQLAVKAKRNYMHKSILDKETKEYIFTESIERLEHTVRISPTALEAAKDPDIALSSSNPYQRIEPPASHSLERSSITSDAATASSRLSSRRAFIHGYVLSKYSELKYSGIADDVFSRIRERVDSAIGGIIPTAIKRLTAVYDNLRSENPEDWSNAVHSCRRILQDLADAVYVPQKEDKITVVNNKEKRIKLGEDNYINRLIAFVEEHGSSKRFNDIVGSHLKYLGDRLDAVFQAAQKGSHATIINKEEADRYVVYTYLIIGDILSLLK